MFTQFIIFQALRNSKLPSWVNNRHHIKKKNQLNSIQTKQARKKKSINIHRIASHRI